MNAYALAAVVTLAVFCGGAFCGFVLPIVADIPHRPRLVLTHACAFAAGFAACALALVLRT